MNQMDVDPTLPSSTSKRPADFPPTSSSAEKRAKISNGQLATLTSNMESTVVKTLVDAAKTDDSLWPEILPVVFEHLTAELESTNMKDSVIAKLSLTDARVIVKGFNKEQLEEWKVGVRNGNWLHVVCTFWIIR